MADEPIVSSDDVAWSEQQCGELFAFRRRRLSLAAGGRALGCSMYELDPGKTAFAYHYHLGNEEAVYVLAGEGTLRLADRRMRLRAGDYVALPAGEAHAHQITNTGTDPLRYLAISTMCEPDVVVYPDSDKIGVFAGAAEGGETDAAEVLRLYLPTNAAVDAYAGEPGTDTDPEVVARKEAEEKAEVVERKVDDEMEALKRKLGLRDDD